MPYKISKQDDGKFAVHKLDENGKPTGKPMGMHKTMAEAQAQMRALYAAEKKPKKETTLTMTATDEDGEVVEEKNMYIDGYVPEPVQVEVVNPVPGPLSFADLMAQHEAQEKAWKMEELTYQFQQLSRNIMHSDLEDKASALTALADEYTMHMQECMSEKMEDEKSLLKQIAGDNQPLAQDTPSTQDAPGPETKSTPGEDSPKDTQSLYIWKEGNTYKWLAAYSNNRRDSDNPPEIISSESHKEFDHALHTKEWPMPELWIWHIPLAVGRTTYHIYDESTGFPLAGGVFNKGFEWAAEGLEKAGWNGVSHGMPSEWIQRSQEDGTIITRHRTKEISILPQWAAANKLAFNIISKESNMAEQEKALPQAKKDELISAFGDNAKQFLEAVENTSKEADQAGIEKKEVELTPDSPLVKALKEIVDTLTALDTRLKALEVPKEVEEKEEPFDLISFLQGKSAIGKAETRVDGRSTLAKDKPEEAKQESFTQSSMGIRLTLADQFIQTNQAYYAEKGGK